MSTAAPIDRRRPTNLVNRCATNGFFSVSLFSTGFPSLFRSTWPSSAYRLQTWQVTSSCGRRLWFQIDWTPFHETFKLSNVTAGTNIPTCIVSTEKLHRGNCTPRVLVFDACRWTPIFLRHCSNAIERFLARLRHLQWIEKAFVL